MKWVWHAYKATCTALVTALIAFIGCLYAGLDPDPSAAIGLITGVMVVSGAEMRVKW